MKLNSEICMQLNQIKYNQKDCDFVQDYSGNSKVKVSSELCSWPSAVGWDAIFMVIRVTFLSIVSGYTAELGADLYRFSKDKIRPLVKNKEDFDESRIIVKTEKYEITIYCNSKEDFLYVLENIHHLVDKNILTEGECKENEYTNYSINFTANSR